ncbi:MAG: Wzt carbohydrate-binding domain-containing protein, partial [Lachnospiraceae bacterium]|nr:Wzt carbohydrate-binding domain-containing protein [Lachnospiraceae bacterium]
TKILRPTDGTIEIDGRISSLIELGAGFHPDMSGRENIYINASIFGFTSKEIDKRINSIIRFSELEDFIDNPIRTYSSGMYMRLAFSVAINVDADILLIDEILGVGDSAFQAKCFNKLKELKEQGTTIVIVSHALGQVEQICDRAIWISNGLIKEEGEPRIICKKYTEAMEQLRRARIDLELGTTENLKEDKEKIIKSMTCRKIATQCCHDATREGGERISFTKVELLNERMELCTAFNTGEAMFIKLQYESLERNVPLNINVSIVRHDWIPCYTVSSHRDTKQAIMSEIKGTVVFSIDQLLLLQNSYYISLELTDTKGNHFDTLNNILEFAVMNRTTQEFGIISMQHEWDK